MTLLEQLALISTIIQAILVVISLGLILFQLRQNAELAKAANSQSLVEHASSFNSLLIQNSDIAGLWYSYGKGLSEEELERYREMLVQWLIFHENIYYQHTKKLLDDKLYISWREDLKHTVKKHNLTVVTNDFEAFFPSGFGQHLTQLRKEESNPAFAGTTYAKEALFAQYTKETRYTETIESQSETLKGQDAA